MLTSDRHLHATTDHESAFTMIELLVAMVLLAIVIGGLIFASARLFEGRDSLIVGRAAQRDSLEAMEQMRHDLGAAQSPALAIYDDRREALRNLLFFRDAPTGSYVSPSRELCGTTRFAECLPSIVAATPREVWFRSSVDAHDSAAAQCVGFAVDGTQLVRYVTSQWQSCGPASRAGARSTTLLTSRLLKTASVFSYSMRFNPAMTRATGSDVAGCRTLTSPSVSDPRSRAFITSVEIDLTGIATRRTSAALAALKTSASIPAQASGDYAFAAGCAP